MIKLSLDHFISTANARCSLRPCTRAPHDDTTNPISPRLYGETKLQMGDQDDRREQGDLGPMCSDHCFSDLAPLAFEA
ncbi:hypothetical protein F2Q69_00010013 [Brassica cretica]|uniref:Uncharacterized protein n=1 Tax=Brassica cretica TaxID=69181 RepID=A0A8S9NN88_BRACR|nr:hypothetical protein F2Q69_00010013 [Brassica cretica]